MNNEIRDPIVQSQIGDYDLLEEIAAGLDFDKAVCWPPPGDADVTEREGAPMRLRVS